MAEATTGTGEGDPFAGARTGFFERFVDCYACAEDGGTKEIKGIMSGE